MGSQPGWTVIPPPWDDCTGWLGIEHLQLTSHQYTPYSRLPDRNSLLVQAQHEQDLAALSIGLTRTQPLSVPQPALLLQPADWLLASHPCNMQCECMLHLWEDLTKQFTCCHIYTEVANKTCHFIQSQCTDIDWVNPFKHWHQTSRRLAWHC